VDFLGPLDPTILAIVGAVFLLAGLALAFAGRRIWGSFMSLIGAFIGGSLGYVMGAVIGGLILALMLSIIGAIIGSILFGYLVKIALAFLVGLLAAALAFFALGGQTVTDPMAQDPIVIVALLVLVGVFSVTYYFIEELLGVITALIGGILLGAGAYLLLRNLANVDPGTAGLVAVAGGGLIFVVGAIKQTADIRARKRALASARRVSTPPPPPP
jgi:MFS family permease